jgi:bifunctional enzyme CysN/CysC
MSAALALDEAPQESRSRAEPGQGRGLLRFITCGSVDDGKSTLIGRLLYDAGAVPDDQLAALEADSRRFGTQGDQLDLALLLDGLSAEREQGITIDVAYRYFASSRRAFIVADTPGHEQYTRNMATGASGADLAIILVDARKGILPQTRRHSFIVSMVGVRRVVVAVNKMDLVGFDRATFDAIAADYRKATAGLGFSQVVFIPVSALRGDNVGRRSASMPWYRGPSLLEHLETAELGSDEAGAAPARLPVQWVNRPDSDFRGYAGTIASGRFAPGDAVRVLPSGATTRVSRIHTPAGESGRAEKGAAVTLVLADEVDVSRGDVIVAADDVLRPATRFVARLLWMAEESLSPAGLMIRHGHVSAAAAVSVESHVDMDTLAEGPAATLGANGIGRVRLTTGRPLVATLYRENRDLGGFILVDRLTNATVALGVIEEIHAPGECARSSAAHPWRAAFSALLRPYEGSEQAVLHESAAWRGVSAVAVAAVVAAVSGSLGAGLAAGLADAILRTLLRAGHREVFARLRNRGNGSQPIEADGSGI